MASMNTGVNNKRVFCVAPHRPHGLCAKCSASATTCGSTCWSRRIRTRPPWRFSPPRTPTRPGSARDELVGYYQTGAELLGRTPNLLIVSTNGAGYDTVDVKACTERGILVVNQSGGNAEAVAEHVIGMMLCLVKRVGETDRALRAGTLEQPRRLYRPRGIRQNHRHRRPRQCRPAHRRTRRHAVPHAGARLRSVSDRRGGACARRRPRSSSTN